MTTAQHTRPTKPRALCVLLAGCVAAATLITVAPTASADHGTRNSVPNVGDFADAYPDRRSPGDWVREAANCGPLGCPPWSDHFLVTTKVGATADWFIPNTQGVYRLQFSVANHFSKDRRAPSGRIRWTVYEFRPEATGYTPVASFLSEHHGESRGLRMFTPTFELDGAVMITAEMVSGSRVGVEQVRLKHVDLLPEHVPMARDMCVDGLDRLKSRLSNAIAAVGATVAVAGMAAATVASGGTATAVVIAAMTTAASEAGKYIATEVLEKVANELIGINKLRDAAKGKTSQYLNFNSSADLDALIPDGAIFEFNILGFAEEYVLEILQTPFGGYSKFADDIAELSANGTGHETFGGTWYPKRGGSGTFFELRPCPSPLQRSESRVPWNRVQRPNPATDCTTAPTPTTTTTDTPTTDTPTTTPTPRTVLLRQTSVDAVDEGKCRFSCTWLSVSVSGFSPGTYRVHCYTHNTPDMRPWRYPQADYTLTVDSSGSASNQRVCFNGYYSDVAQHSADVYVIVGGINSNTITLRRP